MTKCPFCGVPNEPDAHFCEQCGRKLASQRVSAQKAILEDDFDLSTIDRLRAEKQRLSRELTAMLELATDRDLTASERRSWTAVRKAWQDVTAELTARLQYLSARQEQDRRQGGERRTSDRRKEQVAIEIPQRRSGMSKRQGERRSGRDRRDPYRDTEP
jgi:hypothetical protein